MCKVSGPTGTHSKVGWKTCHQSLLAASHRLLDLSPRPICLVNLCSFSSVDCEGNVAHLWSPLVVCSKAFMFLHFVVRTKREPETDVQALPTLTLHTCAAAVDSWCYCLIVCFRKLLIPIPRSERCLLTGTSDSLLCKHRNESGWLIILVIVNTSCIY